MLFKYKDKTYPDYTKSGPGSRFIAEFAKEYCSGKGLNIGYGSGAGKIFDNDCMFLDIKDGVDCNRIDFIDDLSLDFIFSSHTLEHLEDWQISLENWISKLKPGGRLFLYLPHYSMEYWRPENNKKHKHILYPEDLDHFLRSRMSEVFVTGVDLYWSFCCVAFKRG